ncbi:hypothetical protein LNQ03_03555 [Klebsiella pneumoniae subsp. pneumoniae]|nr:hypothetical protein [Klebsiella pneumoniae subsp. pneumoniae]
MQFWHYLVNLAHGDLGIASATGQPVLHDLLAVFPATLELATLALIVGAVLGIVAGVLCARYAGSPWIWRFAPLPCWATRCPFSGSAC